MAGCLISGDKKGVLKVNLVYLTLYGPKCIKHPQNDSVYLYFIFLSCTLSQLPLKATVERSVTLYCKDFELSLS